MSEYLNEINIDNNKQYVNISAHAYDIIKLDLYAEQIKNDKENITNFLNKIIENFYERSRANLANEVGKREKEIKQILEIPEIKTLDTSKKDSIRNAIKNRIEENIISENINYGKDVPIKFRLNKTVFNMLLLKDDEIRPYYSLKDFLKAIFEAYAELPSFERQKVIYDSFYNKIQTAISKQCCVTIKYIGLSGKDRSIKTYRVKPYKLTADANGNCILKGLSIEKDGYDFHAKEMKPAIFTLYSIMQIDINESQNGFISSEEKKILDNETSRKIIPVRVKFTKSGLTKLSKIPHNRPIKWEKVSENELVFYCDEFQAKNYFWKLRNDVEILEPVSIRNSYKKSIEELSKIYN